MDNQPTLTESGVLLIDKPAGWTSHDVVKFVRCFGFKKVGHCGTLDPQATGLLVLVLGRATRLSDRFANQDKVYTGVMEIGKETYSQDAEGEVIAEADWSQVTEQRVRETFARFVGEQEQVPPMVSAKKQDGQRLYKLARQGISVEREPRPITIHALTVTAIELPEIAFEIQCSKGTYVRTVCADIGRELGCGAYLKTLVRTVSGPFRLENAFAMDTIKTWNRDTVLANFMPLEKVLTLVG